MLINFSREDDLLFLSSIGLESGWCSNTSLLHFEQCQLFAILKALQEFQINWFDVLNIQHNMCALQLVIYPCVLHRFTRWFFATICCSHKWVLCPSSIPKNSRSLECTNSAQTRTLLEAWRSPNHTQEDTSYIDYYCRFLRFRVHTLTSKLKLC